MIAIVWHSADGNAGGGKRLGPGAADAGGAEEVAQQSPTIETGARES